jgi:hypothetical protein
MDRPQTVVRHPVISRMKQLRAAPNIGQPTLKIKPVWLWGRVFFLWLLSPFGESQWTPTKKTP